MREAVKCQVHTVHYVYKKRHTYGTIIVNEENHEPIALLDGRNAQYHNLPNLICQVTRTLHV